MKVVRLRRIINDLIQFIIGVTPKLANKICYFECHSDMLRDSHFKQATNYGL